MLRLGSLGAPFSNNSYIFETTYDFSEDTGAAGDYVMTAGASDAIMVRLLAVKVKTACTSGGSALLTVETSATADAFLNSEPVATFALGAVVSPTAATTGGNAGFIKLAADATLNFSIEAADLTAGKLVFVWEVMKF